MRPAGIAMAMRFMRMDCCALGMHIQNRTKTSETNQTKKCLGRLTPESGHNSDITGLQLGTDFVAKVENSTTPKISQMPILGQLRRRDAQCRQ
jgi:hypothetical protein